MDANDLQNKAYRILDLDRSAGMDDIRNAYLDLVKVWHPDRYQNEPERLRRRAEEQMKQITWAWEQLSGGCAPPSAATSRQLLAMDFGLRWGFIEPDGRTAIEPQFEAARDFVEGLAAVKVIDKWGFVNMDGGLQVSPTYEECGDFSEGLAAVKWYGRWGYVGKDGAFAIPPKFQEAGPFREGSAEVRLGARRGRVNRSGEVEFDAFTAGRHLAGGAS